MYKLQSPSLLANYRDIPPLWVEAHWHWEASPEWVSSYGPGWDCSSRHSGRRGTQTHLWGPFRCGTCTWSIRERICCWDHHQLGTPPSGCEGERCVCVCVCVQFFDQQPGCNYDTQRRYDNLVKRTWLQWRQERQSKNAFQWRQPTGGKSAP